MKAVHSEKRSPGAARAVLAGLVVVAFLPLAVAAFLTVYIQIRFSGDAGAPPEATPQPLEGMQGVKTMSEVMGLLREIPFRARIPAPLAALLRSVFDSLPRALNAVRATAGLVYAYPRAFEPVVMESHDGTPFCGMLALQPGNSRNPALIIAHGLLQGKNTFGILALANRAYSNWGFHVLALDLRDSGDTSRFSAAPLSWGLRESDDIIAAANHLMATGRVSTVGVCGFCIGASSAIIAACRSGREQPMAGGIVALNAYADARRFVEGLAEVSWFSPKDVLRWSLLRTGLALKTLAGGPKLFSDPRSYTREVSAQYYELSEHDLYRNASPVECLGEIEVPCLLAHSFDDPVTPVDEAYDLLAAAIDNPLVDSLIVPSGAHALYSLVCPSWFYTTLKTFFTYWGEFNTNPARFASHSGTDILGNLEN